MVMKLDHDDLNRLIEKISSSDIQEFSLEGEDFKLEIKRNLFNNYQSSNNYLAPQNSLEKQQILLSLPQPIGFEDAILRQMQINQTPH